MESLAREHLSVERRRVRSLDEIAEHYITIFINQCASTDADAGWHAPGQIEWCEEAASAIGGSTSKQLSAMGVDNSGGAKDPDMKMIREVRYLRNTHHDFEPAKKAMLALHKHSFKAYASVIAAPWYQAVYKTTYNQTKTARALGVTVKKYNYWRKKGMAFLVEYIRDELEKAA